MKPPLPVETHSDRVFSHHKKEIDPTFFPPENPVIEVLSTAYIAMCDTGCTGITATGYNVRNTIYSPNGRRIIAVDPKVIPLGTIVKIGDVEYVAMDTGGDIKGRRIDVLVESYNKAINYGTKVLKVEILANQ